MIGVDWWADTEEMVMWSKACFNCQEKEFCAFVQLNLKLCPLFGIAALVGDGEGLHVTGYLVEGGEVLATVI